MHFIRRVKLRNYAYALVVLSLILLARSLPNIPLSPHVAAQSQTSTGPINLSNTPNSSDTPRTAVSGSNVYVAWIDELISGGVILFRASGDDGDQFGPTINISGDTSFASSPELVASGNDVYVAWNALTALGEGVFIVSSTDGGNSFGPMTNISIPFPNDNISAEGSDPIIAADGSSVYVAYLGGVNLTQTIANFTYTSPVPSLIVRSSTNSGSSFGPAVVLNTNASQNGPVSMAASGQDVYVAWSMCTGQLGACGPSFLSESNDNGATFASPINLNVNDTNARFPVVAAYGRDLYVAWSGSSSPGNFAINFISSTNSGDTFTPITVVSYTPNASLGTSIYPKLAVSGNNVYVAWNDNRQGHFDAFFAASSNNGLNFSSPVNISNGTTDSVAQGLVASGNYVYIIWDTSVNGNYTISYTASSDNGLTFLPPQLLGNDQGGLSITAGPSLSALGSSGFVAWTDLIGGNTTEIFLLKVSAAGSGLSTGTLMGYVTSNSTQIAGAFVTVTENLGGGRTFYVMATTDGTGQYQVTLFAGAAQVQASEPPNYISTSAQNITIVADTTSTLNLQLVELRLGFVTAALYSQYVGGQLVGPENFDWRMAVDLGLTVTDARGNTYNGWQYPIPIMALPGENVTVCMDGSPIDLPSACQNVTLNSQVDANATFYLFEGGLVQGTVLNSNGNPLPGWTADVYQINSNGQEVFDQVYTGENSTLSFPATKGGEYEIQIDSGDLSTTIRTQVATGQSVNLGDIVLNSGGYFSGSGNALSSAQSGVSNGGTIAMTASFQNNGPTTATSTELIVSAPFGTSIVQGSVAVNGASVAGMGNGSLLVIPLGDIQPNSSGDVKYWLQVSSTVSNVSTVAANAQIKYTALGNITEDTFGTAYVRLTQVTLSAPSNPASPSFQVSGYAPLNSTVSVYDGVVLVGQGQTTPGGLWFSDITLLNLGSPSVHELHAVAKLFSGSTYTSGDVAVVFDSSMPQITQVCMEQENDVSNTTQPYGRHVCFDPTQGPAYFPYVFTSKEPFFFNITFDQPNEVYDVMVILDDTPNGEANATLGQDGIYHASMFNISAGDPGNLHILYGVKFNASLAQSSAVNATQIRDLFPVEFSNFVVGQVSVDPNPSENSVAATITFPNLDNASARVNITLTYGVAYDPTPEDLSLVALTGVPLYGVQTNGSQNGNNFSLYFSAYAPENALGNQTSSAPADEKGPAVEARPLNPLEFVHVVEFAEGSASVGLAGVGISEQAKVMNEMQELEEAAGEATCTGNDPETGAPVTPQSLQMQAQSDLADFGWAGTAGAFLTAVEAGVDLAEVEAPFSVAFGALVADIHASIEDAEESELFDLQKTMAQHCTTPVPPPKPIALIIWLNDPSGFVYSDTNQSRLEGVTATLYQEVSPGNFTVWNATWYGQDNPQITDSLGRYGWDVPVGDWQVRFNLSGYLPAESAIVHVPPPATNVNVGMIPSSYSNSTTSTTLTTSSSSSIASTSTSKVSNFPTTFLVIAVGVIILVAGVVVYFVRIKRHE